MKEYEIVIRTKIIYKGDTVPDDDLVITPIKRAIRDKVKIMQASHEIIHISDKIEKLFPEEEPSI